LKVVELRESLDDYLRKNQTSFASRSSNSTNLSTFYDKLGASSARSPAKRQSTAEKVQDAVTSGDEAPKKGRRKTVAPLEESVEGIRDSAFLSNANRAVSSVTDLVKTPAKDVSEAVAPRRSSILASPGNLDTSPRAVADYLERNTRKASAYISDGISRTHITEYSDYARDLLSSPVAFIGIAFAIEFLALSKGLIELRHAFGIHIPFYGKIVPVSLPDVFVFITPEFLAPFSLFLTVNGILPILAGYFFNYSLKSATNHSHNTRRASAQQEAAPLVDPLVFNIAKGLLAYLVYGASEFTGVYPFSGNTISVVNTAIPFGYGGIVTSSFIGATVALYEAVLKK
jgi:hypothetical protein